MVDLSNPDVWIKIIEILGLVGIVMSAFWAGLAYVLKKFIDRSFDAKLEMIKAEQSIHIDRQIGLNIKRATAIETLYFDFVEYTYLFQQAVTPEFVKASEEVVRKHELELQKARKKWEQLAHKYSLYMSEALESKMLTMSDVMRLVENEYFTTLRGHRSGKMVNTEVFSNLIDTKTVPTIEALKADFRQLLGVEP